MWYYYYDIIMTLLLYVIFVWSVLRYCTFKIYLKKNFCHLLCWVVYLIIPKCFQQFSNQRNPYSLKATMRFIWSPVAITAKKESEIEEGSRRKWVIFNTWPRLWTFLLESCRDFHQQRWLFIKERQEFPWPHATSVFCFVLIERPAVIRKLCGIHAVL